MSIGTDERVAAERAAPRGSDEERQARSCGTGSVCFVSTGPPMLRLLTGEGPDAMGGAELQLSLLSNYLRSNGWGVTFLVGDYGQQSEIVTEDGTRAIKAYPREGEEKTPGGALRDANRLWRSLAEVDADVYVCRGLTGQAGVVAAWCKSYDRPYVFWFAKNVDALYGIPWISSLPVAERLPAAMGIGSADAVILQTDEQGELLERHFSRPGVLIRNAFPVEEQPHRAQDGGYVLWIGSIQPKKRPEMLLEIAAWLPDVQFVMAGGPLKNYPDYYKRVRRELSKLPNVDYRGFVPYEETPALFREASLLLSTSDPLEEGFPNIFLQAWAAGVPVASTCDPDGVISRNEIGCRFRSAADGIDKIRDLMQAPQERERLAERARRYVDEHHSIEQMGRRFEDVLASLLEETSLPVNETW